MPGHRRDLVQHLNQPGPMAAEATDEDDDNNNNFISSKLKKYEYNRI